MATLERRALELRQLVRELLAQFQEVESAVVNGPHTKLSLQELGVVEYLGDSGPHMMAEVAEFLQVAANSVTSTVDNLEKKALVRRERSERDRRVVRVEL